MIEPLADIKPFNKFVAIKCVIFLSFWQSVLISILAHFEYIEGKIERLGSRLFSFQSSLTLSTLKVEKNPEFKAMRDSTLTSHTQTHYTLHITYYTPNANHQTPTLNFVHSNSSKTATMDYSEEDVSKGLQDFLICIEMAIAATLHRYICPPKTLNPKPSPPHCTGTSDTP